MVNLSGTERWRELCRLVGIDDGGLDYSTPEGLSRLSDREWNRPSCPRSSSDSPRKSADQWEAGAAARHPRRSPSATPWPSGSATTRRGPTSLRRVRRPGARIGAAGRSARADWCRRDRRRRRSGFRRHGGEQGALGRPPRRRPLELLGRSAGGAAVGRAGRRRREGGAARRRGRVPDDAGAAQHLCRRQSVEARARPRSQDAPRIGRGCSTSWPRPTSSSRTPWRAHGSGSGSTRRALREVESRLVYARAKGFGVTGPLATRPTFDYVVQAATGMEMTQGGGGGRCRGTSGQRLRDGAAAGGRRRARAAGPGPWRPGHDRRRLVGHDRDAVPVRGRCGAGGLTGSVPRPGRRGPRRPVGGPPPVPIRDGWVAVCCVTDAQRAALRRAVGSRRRVR